MSLEPVVLSPVEDLIYAITRKDAESALKVLEGDVDVNARNAADETLLSTAVRAGLKDVVQRLLEKGADINDRGYLGLTALMYAAFHLQPDIVLLLLNEGADVGLRDNKGSTAQNHVEAMTHGGAAPIAGILKEAARHVESHKTALQRQALLKGSKRSVLKFQP